MTKIEPTRFFYIGPYFEQPIKEKTLIKFCENEGCSQFGLTFSDTRMFCDACHKTLKELHTMLPFMGYDRFVALSTNLEDNLFVSLFNNQIWIPRQQSAGIKFSLFVSELDHHDFKTDMSIPEIMDALDHFRLKYKEISQEYQSIYGRELLIKFGFLSGFSDKFWI